MESFEPVDGWVIIVPKEHGYKKLSQLQWGDAFLHHQSNDITARALIQEIERSTRPSAKAWYIIPLNNQWRTMVPRSNRYRIVKAYGGKALETPLTRRKADADWSIWANTLNIIKKMKSNPLISNNEIITTLWWSDLNLIEKVSANDLDRRIDVIISKFSPHESIQIIQDLAQDQNNRRLISHWLNLNDKSVKEKLIKIIWDPKLQHITQLEQIIKWIDVDTELYRQLTTFPMETHAQAATREFGEETWYCDIDPEDLIHFYTLSVVKYTEDGHRWMKDCHYFIYKKDLGKRWRIKESLSEQDQELEMISNISIKDVINKQEEWLKRKLDNFNKNEKRKGKFGTGVANWMAFQELNSQINSGTIKI